MSEKSSQRPKKNSARPSESPENYCSRPHSLACIKKWGVEDDFYKVLHIILKI